MIFLWNYFWPTNSTKVTENVSVLVKGLKQPGSVKMARIDDNNANAPQAWRVKGSPKYLTPAEITELKKVSELTWTSTKCSPVTDGCSLPSILIQPQGVVVFVISKD
jgi:beta-xylosidase